MSVLGVIAGLIALVLGSCCNVEQWAVNWSRQAVVSRAWEGTIDRLGLSLTLRVALTATTLEAPAQEALPAGHGFREMTAGR